MYATVSTRVQAQSASMRSVQTPARTSVVTRSALSPAHLSSFKADDLTELCRKKGVTGGRNVTRDSLTAALVKAGVSVADLSRNQLTELAIKLGKPSLSRDLNAARSELASLIGGGGYSAPSSTSSWRSTSAPAASPGRFDSYAKSSTPAARGSSGSAAGGALSNSDLAVLRIDDLRDLVKVTGVELPREPTKDGLISALVAKGVNLSHCTRGMLVDLCNKLGASMAKDAESMRRNLSSVVGRGGGRAAAPASAPSSGRFSSYSAGAPEKASWRRSGSYSAGASSGSGLSAADLASLRIDDLRDINKKVGAVLPRDVTKDGLISALLSKGVTLSALPRAALVDLCTRKGVPTARDAQTMIKNLGGKVGGAAAPAAAASSGSSSSLAPPLHALQSVIVIVATIPCTAHVYLKSCNHDITESRTLYAPSLVTSPGTPLCCILEISLEISLLVYH